MVGVVAVILVTVIIVIATSGGNNGSVGESGSPSLSNTKNFARLTEEEKYVKFSAEFICYFASDGPVEDDGDVDALEIASDIKELGEKYGYTEDELVELKDKYDGDSNFEQLVLDETRDFCPETIAALEAAAE